VGGGGEDTELVCGYFHCDELLFNAFPPPPTAGVCGARPRGTASALLGAAIRPRAGRWLTRRRRDRHAPRSRNAAQRGAAALCRAVPDLGRLLAATADPIVGRGPQAHARRSGHQWSIEALARAAGTSRSVLGGASRRARPVADR